MLQPVVTKTEAGAADNDRTTQDTAWNAEGVPRSGALLRVTTPRAATMTRSE